MKRLLLAILVLFFTCLPAHGDDTEVVGGGGGVSDGADLNLGFITATSISVGSGTAADPAVAVGGANGIYEFSANSLGFAVGGAEKWRITAAGAWVSTGNGARLVNTGGGSATSPLHSFVNNTQAGIGFGTSDTFSLIAENTEAARVHKNGIDIKVAVAFSGISTIAADYVMGNFTTDPTFFIECDAALGNISTTLPPVADKKGRLLEIKLLSASNGCYLDGNGAETIDGVTGKAITTQYNAISLIAGSSEWLIY